MFVPPQMFRTGYRHCGKDLYDSLGQANWANSAGLLKLIWRGRFEMLRFGHDRVAALQRDVLVHVGGCILQLPRRILCPERVGPPATARSGLAALVLPIPFIEEHDIHPPDTDRAPRFDRLSCVHEVAPDHVPAGVIVM